MKGISFEKNFVMHWFVKFAPKPKLMLLACQQIRFVLLIVQLDGLRTNYADLDLWECPPPPPGSVPGLPFAFLYLQKNPC